MSANFCIGILESRYNRRWTQRGERNIDAILSMYSFYYLFLFPWLNTRLRGLSELRRISPYRNLYLNNYNPKAEEESYTFCWTRNSFFAFHSLRTNLPSWLGMTNSLDTYQWSESEDPIVQIQIVHCNGILVHCPIWIEGSLYDVDCEL